MDTRLYPSDPTMKTANPANEDSAFPGTKPKDENTEDFNERKLMFRIDCHVIPWLALLYLLNFLDRGSVGNANV
jgi:hypothetical protein